MEWNMIEKLRKISEESKDNIESNIASVHDSGREKVIKFELI